MNYVRISLFHNTKCLIEAHIFREGTFITVVVGPLAFYLPRTLSMVIIRVSTIIYVSQS